METVKILGENRLEKYTRVREACRGVVLQDGKILMTYATKHDFWMIPGGGMETGETVQQCCMRELAEETGFIVDVEQPFVMIDEYYGDWLYRSYYFTCRINGEIQRQMTDDEINAGLETRWIPLADAVTIFSQHHQHVDEELKRGAYLREYSALTALLNEVCL